MFKKFCLLITFLTQAMNQAPPQHSLTVGQSQLFQLDHELTASPKGLAHVEWEDHTQCWKVTAKKAGLLILQDSIKTLYVQITKPETSWVCQYFQCTPLKITGKTEDYELFFQAKEHNQGKRLWSVELGEKGQEKWSQFLENIGPKASSISVSSTGYTYIKARAEHIPELKKSLKPSLGFKNIFFFEDSSPQSIHLKSKVILITHSNQSSKGLEPDISLRKSQPEFRLKVKNTSEHQDINVIAEPSLRIDFQRPAAVQSYQQAYNWTFTLQTKPVLNSSQKIDIAMIFDMKSSHKHYLKTSLYKQKMESQTFLGSIDIHTQSDKQHFFSPFEHIPILAPIFKTSEKKKSRQTIEFWICTFLQKNKNHS